MTAKQTAITTNYTCKAGCYDDLQGSVIFSTDTNNGWSVGNTLTIGGISFTVARVQSMLSGTYYNFTLTY